jgi:hypothetical protein
MGRTSENTLPNIKNTSFKVTTRMTVPSDGVPSGAIFAQGGSFGGSSLFCKDGVPAYCHDFCRA